MAGRGEKGCCGEDGAGDLYSVLGLDKECSTVELKSAYRKLAMRWHPDRCSASDSAQVVDHAKNKFQEIQGAYSVLSDCNKRLMYDVGFYHGDDDDNGMGDFLGEMAVMMSNNKPDPGQNVQESFQELQDLFMEMFHSDDDARTATTTAATSHNHTKPPPLRTSSLPTNFASMARGSTAANNLKRDCGDMTSGAARSRTAPGFADPFTSSAGSSFCFGAAPSGATGRFTDGARSSGIPSGRNRRAATRRQKVSSRQGVSSWDPSASGVSAS